MDTNILTAERLRTLFHYDPETGVFTHRTNRRGSKSKAGDVAGGLNGHGYLAIRIDYCLHLCHRLAWLYVHNRFPPHGIDHIDGNGLNNRITNLREATQGENLQNQRRARSDNKSSGLLGVTWDKSRGKWMARIGHDGKHKYLGRFSTAEEAHAEYLRAKSSFHSYGTLERPDGELRGPYVPRGCYFSRRANRWIAEIKRQGVKRYLGSFPTEEMARTAYIKASQENHAE